MKNVAMEKEIKGPEPFTEEEYAERMNEAEKLLAPISSRGYYTAPDGCTLSYVKYSSADARANVVISIGFTEFAEKYTETAYYLVKAGFDVFTFEHRGHGYSHRDVSDPQAAHVDDFGMYTGEFSSFVKSVVCVPTQPQKTFLLCHSMGCAVAGIALAEDGLASLVSGVIFSSPMVSLAPKGLPEGYLLSFVKKSIKKDGRMQYFRYAPGFDPNAVFEKSGDTSFARFRRNIDKRIENDNYKGSRYTNGWLYEAIRGARKFIADAPQINIPCLVMTAEHDTTIKRRFQKKLARWLPDSSYVCFKGAKHSLYTSEYRILKDFLRYVFVFLETH